MVDRRPHIRGADHDRLGYTHDTMRCQTNHKWLILALLFSLITLTCNIPTPSTQTPSPTHTMSPESSATETPVNPVTPTTTAFELRDNLARGKPVRASSSTPSNPPELAVDGQAGFAYAWASAGGDQQWIEIDLGSPATIDRIELLVSQPRTTETRHQVWGRTALGSEQLLHEFQETTSDGQLLAHTPSEPWRGVQSLRIETHQTPSLAAWEEIQVFGAPEAEAPQPVDSAVTVVFYNGQVITMEDSQPMAGAIAIKGQLIQMVGENDQVLAGAGPNAVLIDLGGRTLMPGFVDTHSHVFDQAGSLGEDLYSVQTLALRHGVTSIGDMWVTADLVDQMREIDRAGELRLRLSLYLAYNDSCGVPLPQDWYLAYPQSIEPEDRLHITGIKVFADGGSCNAPAVSFEYPNGVGRGDLYHTQEQMNAIVASIQEDGYQAAVHALGDRAVDQLLNAIEAALTGGPNTYRHRMEHSGVVHPDAIARYSQVQPVATIFGAFPTCSRLGEPTKFKYRVPAEYQTYEWRWRDLIEANPDVVFAWHMDTPVFDFDTIRQLWGFVTRMDISEDGSICQPPEWLAANTLPVDVALKLMTINAAYALFREEQVGSLREGKFADLIILSGNPLTIDPASIIDIEVLMTMVDGSTAHCAPGFEHLCP